MSLLHRRSPGIGSVRIPTYEVLTFTLVGSVTATNNGTTSVDLVKGSGSSNWGSDAAYTAVGWAAPVTLEFNKEASSGDNGVSYAMISLNEDPTTNANYDTLDYAAYPYRTDVYSIYHNSSQVLFSGAWSPSNKFYIVYRTDGTLLHYNGSSLLYSVSWGTGKTLYIDSAFYSVNSTYSRYSNVRLIRRTWNGTTYT